MSNRAKTILLFLIDGIIFFIALTMALVVRKLGHPHPEYLARNYELFVLIFPFWILMYFIEGLYTLKTYNPANLPISIMRGTALSVIVSIILIYLLPFNVDKITPKTNLLLVGIATVPLIYFWRRTFFPILCE